jgi:hypothetical protein
MSGTHLTSGSSFERPSKLIEVVVVVTCKAGDPISQCEAAAAEMDAAALPFCGRERSQEREHLVASPA